MIKSKRIKFFSEELENLLLKTNNNDVESKNSSIIYQPKEDLKIIFSDIVESKLEKKETEDSSNKNELYSETLADIYIEQGNYEHAIRIYEKILTEKPEKSDSIKKKLFLLKKYLNQQ